MPSIPESMQATSTAPVLAATLESEVRQLSHMQWWEYAKSPVHCCHNVGVQQASTQKLAVYAPTKRSSTWTAPDSSTESVRNTWNAQ